MQTSLVRETQIENENASPFRNGEDANEVKFENEKRREEALATWEIRKQIGQQADSEEEVIAALARTRMGSENVVTRKRGRRRKKKINKGD